MSVIINFNATEHKTEHKTDNTAEHNNDSMRSPMILDILEIKTLIPHRYPMLLIDRVEIVELGKKAIGIKNVTLNEWYFQGHFPERPVMPGVLIVEAMAQAAATLVMKSLKEDGMDPSQKLVYFMNIEEAKFRKPVVPGDTLRLVVEKERSRGAVWRFKGKALVEGALTSEATFTAMIADQ